MSNSTEASMFNPPPLPAGYEKHHIVCLEAVHVPLPKFEFPHNLTAYQRTAASEIAERIAPATIVISNVADVTPSDMDNAPNLQLLAVMATGMGWVDKEYCAKRKITVVNCPQSNVAAVTEHVLALYFASRKRVPEVDRRVRETELWRDQGTVTRVVWPDGPPLGCAQETLGIIGHGALGKNVERLCKAIGFGRVLISERKGVPADQVRPGRTSFDEILRVCTTIVILVPREPDTLNLFDEPEFRVMRKDALLINVARGGIVNEAALATALRSRQIFGAATDVFDTEPCSYTSESTPLVPDLGTFSETEKWERRVPNLIISSHVAWFSGSTIATLQKLLKDGMEAFVAGRLHEEYVRGNVAVHEGKIWK